MKNLSKWFVFFVFGVSISMLSYTTEDMSSCKKNINQALSTANVNGLLVYFNESVDLSLPTADDSYGKSQAAVILKKFFEKNPVKKYVQKHSGKSVDGSVFIIGDYTTTAGKTFGVYVLIKSMKGKNVIQRLEIEEE